MTGSHDVKGESRLLIDGKLVEASSGAGFDNIDPTTEEVLGTTADGTAADMQSAIAARAAPSTTRPGPPTTTCAGDASSSCMPPPRPTSRSCAP